MADLKVGDEVKFKTGNGGAMIIEHIDEGRIARCRWFTGTEYREDYFPLTSLMLVPRQGPNVAVGQRD